MAKPEWGTKRQCQSCGAKYYDFGREPIVCPACNAVFDPEAILKARRPRPAAAPKKERVQPAETAEAEDLPADAAEADEVPEAEDETADAAEATEDAAEEIAEDEEELEEDEVMEDTSELGEDDADVEDLVEDDDDRKGER